MLIHCGFLFSASFLKGRKRDVNSPIVDRLLALFILKGKVCMCVCVLGEEERAVRAAVRWLKFVGFPPYCRVLWS